MTTLLQTYVTDRKPEEWKDLFKEATNIAFMVKYMFRESLTLAKEKFVDFASNKANFKNFEAKLQVLTKKGTGKGAEVKENLRQKFVDGCTEKGISHFNANKLWQTFEYLSLIHI